MQGIQPYNYNRLKAYLGKLRTDAETLQLPCDHLDSILEQEKKLKQVYDSYQESLNHIAMIITQYDREYKNIQQLKSYHRRYQKEFKRKWCGQ